MDYTELSFDRLSDFDRQGQEAVLAIYRSGGIELDPQIKERYVLRKAGQIIGTAGLAGRSLRSIAVAPEFEGQGYTAYMLSRVKDKLILEDANAPIFISTKSEEADKFIALGFTKLALVKNEPGLRGSALLYHPQAAFPAYLKKLQDESFERLNKYKPKLNESSALVMNLNPLTKGHLKLIDLALAESAVLHLFILSAEASSFPFALRRKILTEVAKSRPRLIVHETGPWLISLESFPGYFYSDTEEALRSQAALDEAVFAQIATALKIGRRYLGTEELSWETSIYNQTLLARAKNYELVLVERFCSPDGKIISASRARAILAEAQSSGLKSEQLEELKEILPEESLAIILKEYSELKGLR